MCGCRSVTFFCPADPSYKKKMLTTFRSAACWFMLFIKVFCLGLFSFGVLNSSCTETECFALTATTNTSHHFSHSVLCGDSAMSQNAGSHARADGLLEVAPLLESILSRSAML